MASMVVWRDAASGVYVNWNKGGPYTVHLPDDQINPSWNRPRHYPDEKRAVAYAKRKAKDIAKRA